MDLKIKNLLAFLTLFATVWQASAADWGSRLQAEQEWLVQTLTPPVEISQKTNEYVEDSISTGQAAVQKEEAKPTESEILSNPWDLRGSQATKYTPSRKRSR